MTKPVVNAVCRDSGIRAINVDETTDDIMSGARRTFAILVLLGEEQKITKFIAKDQLQPSRIDDRIPFSMDALQDIDPEIAPSFYNQQWEFSAPSFSGWVTRRLLHSDIVSNRVPVA